MLRKQDVWCWEYRVRAKSVEDFLARYYKPDRYTGRGPEYAAALLASYQRDFDEHGYCVTSHHDSKSGEVVAFFGGRSNAK